jgi:hypothetical protein
MKTTSTATSNENFTLVKKNDDAKATAYVHETEEIMGSIKIRHDVILHKTLK